MGRGYLVRSGPSDIFAIMRTTSSFEIFPNEPSERELARARWLRNEGQFDEAEQAYRAIMARQPTLRTSWTECFELLRSRARIDEALALAEAANEVFAGEAFPLSLKGAALIEKGLLRDALQLLETAVERDPDLALTWHELGYAAYRLGDGNRALLALDRAFALEPHTETLILRGRILRDAGEFFAAEVAFEAARHSAEHEGQAVSIDREVEITRRRGAFAPQWIREMTQAEEWFAEHGTTVLAAESGESVPVEEDLVTAFVELSHDRNWRFGQILALDEHPAWARLTDAFGVAVRTPDQMDPDRVPLLVGLRSHDSPGWTHACSRIGETMRGLSFVLWHDVGKHPVVDIVGALTKGGHPLPLIIDPSTALVMAQHPVARVAHRILQVSPTKAVAG